ncbi:MAG: UDP-N-acetylmuramoyl-L-alanine--D-glutamate ligase [Bacteroidales bacterium]|nr:UDP-N-acetylmuramoyl-L-alanine--D-glutamate ligase [Bacteroidales bacterium]
MSKIVILGAGESGVGAAVLAKKKGFEVFVSDYGTIKPQYAKMLADNNIPYEQGKHTESQILDAQEVIKSPGIKNDAPIVLKLVAANIPVISEIEFAARYAEGAHFVCITGSNGKTTTTELTYSILKKAGLDVAMAGNVGNSLAMLVAGDHQYEYYVLELSSFQLDNMYDFRADVAVITNITPDHLDRYDFKMQNYTDSKFRITRNQRENDVFIYFADDPILDAEVKKREWVQQLKTFSLKACQDPGAFFPFDDNYIEILDGFFSAVLPFVGLPLRGAHNRCNIMAAVLAARSVDVHYTVIEDAVREFKPLEHRVEPVGEVDGVQYVNDSKGTNVDAVWYALDTVGDGVVLILGGVDKGNDYSQLFDLVDKKVKAIVAMGVDNTPIHKAFDGRVKNIVDVRSMAECIEACRKLAVAGDTVLLSPACASFDLFTCYEDRGEQFKAEVKKLMEKK